MSRSERPRLRGRPFAAAMLALTTVPALWHEARADCVAPLAACATSCDQRLRPQDPDRPQCAQSCISEFQSCRRLEQIQSNTANPVLNERIRRAPAR